MDLIDSYWKNCDYNIIAEISRKCNHPPLVDVQIEGASFLPIQ